MYVYNVFCSQSTCSYPLPFLPSPAKCPYHFRVLFSWFLKFKDKECESSKEERSPYRLGKNGAYKVLKGKQSQFAAPEPADLSFPST